MTKIEWGKTAMKHIFIFVTIISAVLTLNLVTLAQSDNPTVLGCGDIIESETTEVEPTQTYALQIRAGTTLNLHVEPIGNTFNVWIRLLDAGESIVAELNENPAGLPEIFNELQVSSSNPLLAVAGALPDYTGYFTNTGLGGGYYARYFGAYTVYVGCVLRDGTVIQPGDTMPEVARADGTSASTSVPIFSGFGFPGVAPRDFSAGVEIPLTLGQSQTAPIASDVALYTYTASASESRVLMVSRLSGDISIGVTVIDQDTNAIIFLGGMPFSESLTATLNFPADGTYAIGLFRLDTTELTGTSGAVQIVIE